MKMPTDRIREEILQERAISFERFMEIALYCPESGYYETEKDIVGRSGDFITSVSVGSLFGELLAFQFAAWLDQLKIQNQKLRIIEAGAHDGKLAADILGWLKIHRPELFSELEYCILEPSIRRRQWQQQTLQHFPNIRWFQSVPSAVDRESNGVLFGNELLDAFPVRRLGWDAPNKKWFEWGVALEADKLTWSKLPDPKLPPSISNLPSALLNVLPDGYIIEDSPAAQNWWREATEIFGSGKYVAIDYGFTDEEMIVPERTRGTLRAYYRHQVTNELLANPGKQDLTAHVNFSAIQRAGEQSGLKTDDFCAQPQFLTRILQNAMQGNGFGEWNASRTRQLQTLTHPEHLGRAFRVLVQSREKN